MCECHPLQTQHFFIFLFASFKKWLILIFFVNLCYSYSMEHRLSLVLLVTLTGCFGFQVSARQQNSAAQLLLNSNGANHCVQQLWVIPWFQSTNKKNCFIWFQFYSLNIFLFRICQDVTSIPSWYLKKWRWWLLKYMHFVINKVIFV